jgi:hydroxymethylpyrimidine/phosphomethylpyrimidine kinase
MLHDTPRALTIAGSDSGGGAGIQADLRTFAFHAVHGMSAITCVTAQNTVGVQRVDAMTPTTVVAQIQSVVTDIGVDAVKTGMLLNQTLIETVAQQLAQLNLDTLVVDPVMVSRTGAQLIDDNAIASLCTWLIPQALIVTPNRYEAQILASQEITNLEQMQTAAQKIHQLGPQAVLVKGGSMSGDCQGVDVWFDGEVLEIIQTEVVQTPHTHGTGCTLSAAIAANLARGNTPLTAVKSAKHYVTRALQYSLALGKGQGPIGHFYPFMERREGITEKVDQNKN